MKTLITGGAGFIGYHLAKKISAAGEDVTIVDNFSRGVRDDALEDLNKNNNVSIISIDLLDEEQLKKLESDYDVIFHLAAIIGVQNVLSRPYEVLDKNERLLVNMINVARRQNKLNRFVFSSTSEVYAGTLQYFDMEIPTPENTPLTITDLDHPRTSYMLSKIYGEALLKQSGLPTTIIRPHNFYGPRMGMSHVIPELLNKAYHMNDGDELVIQSPGHKRTFCFIDDAVEMIVRLSGKNETAGETYNIGNESPEISIKDLAKIICEVTGKNLKLVDGPVTTGSPERRCPDMKKTCNACGYSSINSLSTGVEKTFEWYREHIFEGKEKGAK